MKNVWLWNHYATNMCSDRGGRHYWFAENLIKQGYNATVFCANTIHNSAEIIAVDSGKYTSYLSADGIPFVFVKTPSYMENGKQRIKNMVAFYRNIFPVSKDYAKINGKPDVILASSVHPLTLVAGIKIAKKFSIPCICEVRDLWPESIVAYGILKRRSILAQALYKGEKWIYKKADSIIMTWEGGKDYIIDQGWDRDIDLAKVKHISNGVVVDLFDKNSVENQIIDSDLDNKNYKNIVYAGSIRKVNNLGMLLDAAKIIQDQGNTEIMFLIYGSGDESEMLKKRCENEGIHNVIFKGRVEKKYVPSILKKAYINILHNSSTLLDKYGQSQNKFFEYLAAGRCIVQTYSTGYSICERANCGISAPIQNAEEVAKAVLTACSNEKKNQSMGENARKMAYEFDFKKLTQELIDVIEIV
ncbi:glycosyltransferase involved in cell wall biosynthesis [Sporomusaceae bacterium BoRhaA]|uniref:glycosyltransferase family 4 protein n=1 Tax=Pelorhabdus rhamnosifermentans TaxID=2772457 RepID=UPI001C06123E|nr:glycosyltransferase family 4 protein [Pelorhabdus rhamnosifermentans]MBU2699068.1 glycosyltransferase involved in cell wall biosynthesis [Pelorhabdus rhamnosifermentans]